jgi:trans-aconitate methyltransferase
LPNEIHPIGTREELRVTFDRVAKSYDRNRPSYPEELFDEVVRASAVDAGSRLLEIGCGTGHATQVFAARGFRIHAIELGENMAALARSRLASFPHVSIEIADFDRWNTTGRFDLVYAATAWHWLDPALREQKISSLLRPSGCLALWRNQHIRNGSSDDFVDAAQLIYARLAPELALERGQLASAANVIDTARYDIDSGLFIEQEPRVYLWNRAYSSAEYIAVLNTHSDHQLLPDARRRQLFDQLAALIDTRFGGCVIKDYATVLQIAHLCV